MALVDRTAVYEALMAPGEGYDILDTQRPEWMARAACAGLPTSSFFPAPGAGGVHERRRGRLALEVCERCPVAGPCRSYAVQEGLEGIYGASTTPERRSRR